MKIAVCVKQVPDATVHKRIDPARSGSTAPARRALNPTDLNAVEEALRIKEAQGEGEVVLVSLGPTKAAESMRKALAMGADRARARLRRSCCRLRPPRHGSRARGRARARGRRISSSSDRRRATATARCCGPRSPSGFGGPSSRRSHRSRSRRKRSPGSARPSTDTTYLARRCRPSSRSRTRSTSRAIPRSRGSWAQSRSRRRRFRSPTSGSTPPAPVKPERRPPSSSSARRRRVAAR